MVFSGEFRRRGDGRRFFTGSGSFCRFQVFVFSRCILFSRSGVFGRRFIGFRFIFPWVGVGWGGGGFFVGFRMSDFCFGVREASFRRRFGSFVFRVFCFVYFIVYRICFIRGVIRIGSVVIFTLLGFSATCSFRGFFGRFWFRDLMLGIRRFFGFRVSVRLFFFFFFRVFFFRVVFIGFCLCLD
jgi:hypothetical protein